MAENPPREYFEIGWICTRPIEVAAARAMLDRDFGQPETQQISDSNTYTRGQIGRHHIMIACLPPSQGGAASAAAALHDMFHTFPYVRIALFVGVGDGIPSQDHDIRLGYIVIGYPQGTCGGIRQFCVGPAGQIRCIERLINIPSRPLLTAVDAVRTKELAGEFPHAEKMTTVPAHKLTTFPRPPQDSLFSIQHEHPQGAATCGDGCPQEYEVTRGARRDALPRTHYGIIASGDVIMDSGRLRENLREATGALCFSMEAAGVPQDFPCVVIQGISNYCDSHKHAANAQWEAYAALAAACYAKVLLAHIPSGVGVSRR